MKEAILIMKDSLSTNISCDSLYNSKIIIVNDTLFFCRKCMEDVSCYHDGIWIALIVCVTFFLLTISVIGLILYLKSKNMDFKSKEIEKKNNAEDNLYNHKMAIEAEKEKSRYRTRLIDYYESNDKENYVKMLKNFIIDLNKVD